jgi:acetolactate synthase-1/2/3 large subunit
MSDKHEDSERGRMTVAEYVALLLWKLGVRQAFGICGREIVPFWVALLMTRGTAHEIATHHARHESGAGFAAIGAWMVSGRPAALFTTTGPGGTNAITSLEAARAMGAKIVMVSPLTPAVERYRGGIQATGPGGYHNPDVYTAGRLFDHVVQIESVDQLPALAGPLAIGLAGPGGFAAHIAIPTTLQPQEIDAEPVVPAQRRPLPGITADTADELAGLFAAKRFGVWVGWGARHHARAIRRLLDCTGAPAICSPRGVGIVDGHPAFLGQTGNGGPESLPRQFAELDLDYVLVLGTGLNEATSGWDERYVPRGGFVHVDLDARVFARAYPQAATIAIQADVGAVVDALLERSDRLVLRELPVPCPASVTDREAGPGVHPADLMAVIQRLIVERTDMPVIADASSSMFWAASHLRFTEPGRFATDGHWGSMGLSGALVVGAAAARGGPALAICGDGSMHMQDEMGTAVRYGIHAIWVVLGDSAMGIVKTGMERTGRPVHDADYPATDFAAVARAKGAQGVRVEREEDLDWALQAAVDSGGPFVVDVAIRGSARVPIGARAKR